MSIHREDPQRLYKPFEVIRAAKSLYYAGRWSCDRPVDEAKLWENLRDALDLPKGTSPK